MPLESDWRSEATANQLMQLDRDQFAIEFLRRNPAYRDDYTKTLDEVAARPSGEAAAMASLARRWGLSFPACTRDACVGIAYALASGALALDCHRCSLA